MKPVRLFATIELLGFQPAHGLDRTHLWQRSAVRKLDRTMQGLLI
jgi:hypothetical protein